MKGTALGAGLRKSRAWMGAHEALLGKVSPREAQGAVLDNSLVPSWEAPGAEHAISPLSSDPLSTSTADVRSPLVGSPMATLEELATTLEVLRRQTAKVYNKLMRSSLDIQLTYMEGLIGKMIRRKWRRRICVDDDWRVVLQCLSLTLEQIVDMESALEKATCHDSLGGTRSKNSGDLERPSKFTADAQEIPVGSGKITGNTQEIAKGAGDKAEKRGGWAERPWTWSYRMPFRGAHTHSEGGPTMWQNACNSSSTLSTGPLVRASCTRA